MIVNGYFIVVFILNILFLKVNSEPQLPKLNFNNAPSTRKLGPCQACKLFISSFNKGMEKTTRGKFEGGDAAWEEEKLRSYARSEVRLVEIQESLCSDIKDNSDQCYSMAEEAESHVEEWWNDKNSESEDIFSRICIDKLQHCCPDGYYGRECKPCIGAPKNVCSGNGKCKGDGSRKGNGQCVCEPGYVGEACDLCSSNYYEAYKDDTKLLCSPCHKSCKDGCTQGGVKACHVCNDGWLMDTDNGCLDVDECSSKHTCDKKHFCVNTDGSFKCLSCDKSCDGCTGDGPDMCDECASGYRLKDDLCVESATIDRSFTANLTRYLTYLGLCITICIIFQKSIWLAGLLGLLVTLYISVSEYMLANDLAGPSPMIDASNIDWASLLAKAG